MKALTLWPEWAWAIDRLDKRVENRDWALPVGEWIALHAGKNIGGRPGRVAEEEGRVALAHMAGRAGWDALIASDGLTLGGGDRFVDLDKADIVTSAILGAFRVIAADAPNTGDLDGWRVPDAYGNRFEYRPLARSVPCKGAQGLWTVPPDVVAEMKRVGARVGA